MQVSLKSVLGELLPNGLKVGLLIFALINVEHLTQTDLEQALVEGVTLQQHRRTNSASIEDFVAEVDGRQRH